MVRYAMAVVAILIASAVAPTRGRCGAHRRGRGVVARGRVRNVPRPVRPGRREPLCTEGRQPPPHGPQPRGACRDRQMRPTGPRHAVLARRRLRRSRLLWVSARAAAGRSASLGADTYDHPDRSNRRLPVRTSRRQWPDQSGRLRIIPRRVRPLRLLLTAGHLRATELSPERASPGCGPNPRTGPARAGLRRTSSP